ncbi:MAG: DUF2782 domain-containing protein [Nitrosomonadales bacterium]|nr:DUF2782 domain-containing protein [Nitrosomonadales bacterium]
MRFLFFLLLSGFSLAAFAQQPVPGNLEPLPPPPAFDAAPDAAPDDVPEVTITKETEQTVEEYRIGGKLYMIKITPKHGVPYYLVDDLGDGKFVRQESLDSGLRVPRWIIHKF